MRERVDWSSHHMLMLARQKDPMIGSCDRSSHAPIPLFDSGSFFMFPSIYSNSEEIWRRGLAHSRVLRLCHYLVSSLIPSRQVQNIYFHGFCTASWIPTIVAQGISLFGHNFFTSAMLRSSHKKLY